MRLEYFELLDRVVSLSTKDGTIRTQSVIPTQSPVFEGHFPGHPIMPGVLLIEAMAQTCGLLNLALSGVRAFPFLAGVNNAKLRNFVTPGSVLDVEGRMLHEGSGFTRTFAQAFVAGSQVCSADLTFRVLPFPSPHFRELTLQTCRRVQLPMEAVADG